jgi:hypothetical protein
MPEKFLGFKKFEVVARGGIEPPTRGFSDQPEDDPAEPMNSESKP